MTLWDGQPLTDDEIPRRCLCGHTAAWHGDDGDECSGCECAFLTYVTDDEPAPQHTAS